MIINCLYMLYRKVNPIFGTENKNENRAKNEII